MTTVDIEYDCGCRYTVPTTLTDQQTALANATAVDTVAALVDAQHEQECPHQPGSVAAL